MSAHCGNRDSRLEFLKPVLLAENWLQLYMEIQLEFQEMQHSAQRQVFLLTLQQSNGRYYFKQ